MVTINEILSEKLLALSWKQPFGLLMLNDKIETRTWSTNYRGLVLICTSKKTYSDEQLFNITGPKQFERIMYFTTASKNLEIGKAIAIGRLIDCRKMKQSDEDKCFVEYYPDLYCHIYKDVRPIKPIPWIGTQGWKEVNNIFKKQLIFI